MIQIYKVRGVLRLCAALAFIAVSLTSTADARELEIKSYKDVEAYFERVGFTRESWLSGSREVPNFTFTTIGENWRKVTVHKIDVARKKRLFFRALAPFGLKANKAVMADRMQLQNILKNKSPSTADVDWLWAMAIRYRVAKEKSGDLSAAQLDDLSNRVDIVPLSLILAQAAEESGWGTSRFTSEGNSLFGQWSWGKNIMRPKQQRAELGDYGLAAFDTVLDAVKSYVHNLNSGPAYVELRKIRATMRANGGDVRGLGLTNGLLKYSERGQDYVDGLQAIMRVNKLADADFTYLSDGEEIVFVLGEN